MGAIVKWLLLELVHLVGHTTIKIWPLLSTTLTEALGQQCQNRVQSQLMFTLPVSDSSFVLQVSLESQARLVCQECRVGAWALGTP